MHCEMLAVMDDTVALELCMSPHACVALHQPHLVSALKMLNSNLTTAAAVAGVIRGSYHAVSRQVGENRELHVHVTTAAIE